MTEIKQRKPNSSRLLYWNYELKKDDGEWKKYTYRQEMIEDHQLTKGSIAQIINDGLTKGATSKKRYKWKNFKIRQIRESKGCLIETWIDYPLIKNE